MGGVTGPELPPGGGCPGGGGKIGWGKGPVAGGGWGHWNAEPDKTISLIRVSMGVFPTKRAKNSCSITADETVLKLGSLKRSLPNLVGWFGY